MKRNQHQFISAREIAQLLDQLQDQATATMYRRRKAARMIRAWYKQQGYPNVKVTVGPACPAA